jgi:hypothetical protein
LDDSEPHRGWSAERRHDGGLRRLFVRGAGHVALGRGTRPPGLAARMGVTRSGLAGAGHEAQPACRPGSREDDCDGKGETAKETRATH